MLSQSQRAFNEDAFDIEMDDGAVSAIQDHGGYIITGEALRGALAPVGIARRQISSGWVAGPALGLHAVAFSVMERGIDKIFTGGISVEKRLENFANRKSAEFLRVISCDPADRFAADVKIFSLGLTWAMATGTMNITFAASTSDLQVIVGWNYDFDVMFAASGDPALLSNCFGDVAYQNRIFKEEFLRTANNKDIAQEAYGAVYDRVLAVAP